jgi:sugar phosphate isomerase/epimerase
MTLPTRLSAPTHTTVPAWAKRSAIGASHLIAHDAVPRTALERATMLREIGLSRIVWDWREEHIDSFDAELDALRLAGVQLAGMWTPLPMPALEEPDYASRFGVVPARLKYLITEAARRGLSPDLWTQISFGAPGAPLALSPELHRSEVQRAADHLMGIARLARGHGMCLMLTNHGGWAGQPQTMIDVVRELEARGLSNVGIGLRLHHAHHLIPDLDRHIATLGDYLAAVMLSGADAGAELSGRVVLPFGAGSRDRWVTHVLMESGWQGQLLVHAVGRDDARARLLDSLEGWEWALDRYAGVRRQRPVARVLEPTWPPGKDWAAAREPVQQAVAREPVRQVEPAPQAEPALALGVPAPYGQEVDRQTPQTEAAASFFATVGRGLGHTSPIPSLLGGLAAEQTGGGGATPDAGFAPVAAAAVPGAVLELDASLSRRERRELRERLAGEQRIGVVDMPRDFGREAPEETYHLGDPALQQALIEALGVGVRGGEPPQVTAKPSEMSKTPPQVTAKQGGGGGEGFGGERIEHGDVRIVAPDPYSGAVHALLLHLEDEGFTGAPRSFGWDDSGRHLLEFVPGRRADHPEASEEALDPAKVGEFLREMHDVLERFEAPPDAMWFEGVPSPGADLVVHHDIVPSNLVVRADGSLVAIDWDAAGPGTRLWDLAHTAHAFAPLYRHGTDLRSSAQRLRRLVDAYGLDREQREELIPLLAARSRRMYEYLDRMRSTGRSPWVELWDKGVGTVWRADAQWIGEHSPTWRAALLG